MHVNELPFINGGEPMLWAPEIPIWFSLVFIGATIAVATVASLMKTRRDDRRDALEDPSSTSAPLTTDTEKEHS